MAGGPWRDERLYRATAASIRRLHSTTSPAGPRIWQAVQGRPATLLNPRRRQYHRRSHLGTALGCDEVSDRLVQPLTISIGPPESPTCVLNRLSNLAEPNGVVGSEVAQCRGLYPLCHDRRAVSVPDPLIGPFSLIEVRGAPDHRDGVPPFGTMGAGVCGEWPSGIRQCRAVPKEP